MVTLGTVLMFYMAACSGRVELTDVVVVSILSGMEYYLISILPRLWRGMLEERRKRKR